MAENVKTKILAALRAAGSEGMTCDELEQALGVKHQSVSARLSELRDAGLTAKSNTYRKTSSGRTGMVWLADGYEAPLDGPRVLNFGHVKSALEYWNRHQTDSLIRPAEWRASAIAIQPGVEWFEFDAMSNKVTAIPITVAMLRDRWQVVTKDRLTFEAAVLRASAIESAR